MPVDTGGAMIQLKSPAWYRCLVRQHENQYLASGLCRGTTSVGPNLAAFNHKKDGLGELPINNAQ